MIGEHVVTVAGVDISCLVDQVAIHHGRDDSGTQPEASTATVDLSLDTGETQLPIGLDVGSAVLVETVAGVTRSVRFKGRVTDIALGWEDRGEDTPNAVSAQVIAASDISELGHRVVGDVPFPQELDGARVARVFNLAGVSLDPAYSDPGRVQILPRDVDAQPALDVAYDAASSAGGVVWQTRTGEVRYADADHRRGTVPSVTLDACDILVTPTWQRTTDGLINKVAIAYGVAPAGGEQPQWIQARDDSVAKFGRYELSQSTALAALGDAQALATLYLTRNSSPVWILQALPVDMKSLSDAETAAILALDMHSLIAVTGLPLVGNVPTNTTLWVEGWSETLAFGEHDLLLSVSGYCRTVPPPRWDDVTPATTWDTASGTWDSWSCQPPQPSLGRWTDIPASMRWNNVAPAITWDTWPY